MKKNWKSLNIPSFEVVCNTADLSQYEIIDSYIIGSTAIFITKDGRYLVSEPELSLEAHFTYNQMMQQLFLSLEPVSGYC